MSATPGAPRVYVPGGQWQTLPQIQPDTSQSSTSQSVPSTEKPSISFKLSKPALPTWPTTSQKPNFTQASPVGSQAQTTAQLTGNWAEEGEDPDGELFAQLRRLLENTLTNARSSLLLNPEVTVLSNFSSVITHFTQFTLSLAPTPLLALLRDTKLRTECNGTYFLPCYLPHTV